MAATQEELLAAYEGIVLQAFQEVEDALVGFARQQDARTQLEEAVRADARAAELARNLYAQGLTDFLTVLVAEQALYRSQDSLAQSQRDVALNLVALYKAVGGGWEVAGDSTYGQRGGTTAIALGSGELSEWMVGRGDPPGRGSSRASRR